MLKLCKNAEVDFKRTVKAGEVVLKTATSINGASHFLIFTEEDHRFCIQFVHSGNKYELINVQTGKRTPGFVESLQLKFPQSPVEVLWDSSHRLEKDAGQLELDSEVMALEQSKTRFWMFKGKIYCVPDHTEFEVTTFEERERLKSWPITLATAGQPEDAGSEINAAIEEAEVVKIWMNRTRSDVARVSCPLEVYLSQSPELVGNDGPENFWLVDKKIYSTSDTELTNHDVSALLNEEKNKRRLRLEKAHALAAMAEQLDSKAKRETIPQDVKMTVWQRDKGRCVECESNKNLEFDHIIPLAMGGSNTIRNLQLLCEMCNRRKGASLG